MKSIMFVSLLLLLFENCHNNTQEGMFYADHPSLESPKLIAKGDLIYPDSLKNNNIKGTVLIECIIDTLGQIKTAKVFKSSNRKLNMAALRTIETYIFSPGKQGDKKISSKLMVPIKFK